MRELRQARDFLIEHRTDYAKAYADFRWPRPAQFNFALDWFDVIGRERDGEALRIVSDDKPTETHSYSELAAASNRLANFLRAHGLARGDRLLLMLGNEAPLWVSLLAAMKLGAVVIPTSTLLSGHELEDRLTRGRVKFVIAAADLADRFPSDAAFTGVAVNGDAPCWLPYADADQASADFAPDGPTNAFDPLLLYFTSGTTSRPKLVLHTHVSYPIGHLSTLYWLGLKPGDRHLNISSPGWAKHAWSCVFAPWLAEASAVVLNQPRFDPAGALETLEREGVTTFCAPPTVWRLLIQRDLGPRPTALRELIGAGEPLNPEVIHEVEAAWGLVIRDGYGQTETTAQVGNPPGQPVTPGAMGLPLPGYRIVVDGESEGEACLPLGADRPLGLMTGYWGEAGLEPLEGEVYRTGDVVNRAADGVLTYVGRADDVFKASDYRISPFELESVLIEHPAVAEAAVVPSPDPMRLALIKAFVSLTPDATADADTARAILAHARERLGPFKRIRRLEVFELPKTISGKIRRVELRALEAERRKGGVRGELEWWEEDFA